MGLIDTKDVTICPKCKRRVIKTIHLNDDKTGKKVCRTCKRQIKKKEV